MSPSPSIYLFFGEDDAAIAAAVHTLQSKLGDPANAEMNTAHFTAPGLSLDDIRGAANAMPFLTERRLVIIEGAGKSYTKAATRAPFISLLEESPPSTALVLVEKTALPKTHWLRKWSQAAGDRAFLKDFALPKGGQMVIWIQKKTVELAGEIEPQAASSLAAMLGSDTRAAQHEIEKLLAYAAYQRPITNNDVADLALEIGEQGDFFGLIDALSAGAGAKAITALRKLMDERDHIALYFGLVGHFRALIQTREIVDSGGNDQDVAKRLSMHPFRAQKLAGQARRFPLPELEAIYNRLAEFDQQIKTGRIQPALAMDTLVASLSVV
jgi:DNA polymerase-3 subunit delta